MQYSFSKENILGNRKVHFFLLLTSIGPDVFYDINITLTCKAHRQNK